MIPLRWYPRILVGLVLLVIIVTGSHTWESPEAYAQRRSVIDRDICAWRAGIRRDTPLMYETTKVLYYGSYVQCMLDCGHPILPLP